MSKILVADDNKLIRNTVRAILASAGHEVLEAGTGREALELARAERPDLILLDYMMPELDGLELLKAARREPELAEVPVLMLTARSGRLDAGEDPRVQHVTKPIKSRELLVLVKTMLNR